MGIDAERTPNAEIAVRLHYGDRKSERIKRADHVVPARSGSHAVDARGAVGLTLRGNQRRRNPVPWQTLSAHGMARAADTDRMLFLSGLAQKRSHVLDMASLIIRAHYPMGGDRGRVEAARVVEHQ